MTDEPRSTLPAIDFPDGAVDQSAPTRQAPLKWVVVVDRDRPEGARANAVACVAAAFGARVGGLLGTDGRDADGIAHAGLPWAGCSLLAADAERLRSIRAAVPDDGSVLAVGMPIAAQESRVYDEYLAALAATPTDALEEVALGLIGPRRTIERLTRRLPLLGAG